MPSPPPPDPHAAVHSYQIHSVETEASSSGDEWTDDDLAVGSDAIYSRAEKEAFVAQLKEEGLYKFLASYLTPLPDGTQRSLYRLLLSLNLLSINYLQLGYQSNVALLAHAKRQLIHILRRRDKLPQYNTVDDAVDLLRRSKRIMILSGAGISTSCGIPDFRSKDGLYAQLQREGKYDLDDPTDMFDMHYFRAHPEVFFSFAKQIYPINFVPSPCHRWIKSLEDHGVLLRDYTQNIDMMEDKAGVQRVLNCHGSFKTATCLRCRRTVPGKVIESYIMEQRVPYCLQCSEARAEEIKLHRAMQEARRKRTKKREYEESSEDEIDEWGHGEPGIMKPDITFFHEDLHSDFDKLLAQDRDDVDLLIVIGTSLKVRPVSDVLNHIPHSVPQILINMERVEHANPDIVLQGDADSIVAYLAHRVGWPIPPPPDGATAAPLAIAPEDGVWISDDHCHLYVHKAEADEYARQLQIVRELREQGLVLVQGSSEEDEESEVSEAALPANGFLQAMLRRSSTPESDRPSKRSRMGSRAGSAEGSRSSLEGGPGGSPRSLPEYEPDRS